MTGLYETRAMTTWLLSSIVVAFAINNPGVDLLIVAFAILVARASPDASPIRGFLLLGVTVTLLRTMLFGLTGHSGSTIIFDLPEFNLALPFTHLELGGTVTYEALVQGIAEGLRLLVILSCFGAFLSHVRPIDLLRLVPRFLFEAALVLNISIVFAPLLARRIHEVRDAQRMRGRAGRTSLISVVSPVFTGALERSVALAESMESRGFGRVGEHSRREASRRTIAIFSLIVSASTGAFFLITYRPILAFFAVISLIILLWALRQLSALVKRTSYSRRAIRTPDIIIGIGSIVAAGLAIVARSPIWDPYALPVPPVPSAMQIAVAGLIAIPAIIEASIRAHRFSLNERSLQ